MSENNNGSKWSKPVSPNSKSTKRLKKIFGFLAIAYLVVFVFIYGKNKYAIIPEDAFNRLGAGNETNITIDKTLKIKERSIDRFKKYLINGNFESAIVYCED